MPQTIEFEGTQHEFPDDFSSDDIAKALKSHAPVAPDTTPTTVSAAQSVSDAAANLGRIVSGDFGAQAMRAAKVLPVLNEIKQRDATELNIARMLADERTDAPAAPGPDQTELTDAQRVALAHYQNNDLPPAGSTPILKNVIPRATGDTVLAGAERKGAELVEGLSSPENILLAALGMKAPQAVGRAILGAFGAQAATTLPEKYRAIVEAQTPGEIGAAYADLIGTGAMAIAPLLGRHGLAMTPEERAAMSPHLAGTTDVLRDAGLPQTAQALETANVLTPVDMTESVKPASGEPVPGETAPSVASPVVAKIAGVEGPAPPELAAAGPVEEPVIASTEPPAPVEPAPVPAGSATPAPSSEAASLSSAEGGTPESPAQPGGGVVALRMSFTDAQREKMGLPKWVDPAKLTNKAAWDRGQSELAANPEVGKQLVAEMNAKPRPLEPHEKAILLHEEGLRDTAYHAALDAVNDAKTEGEHLSAQTRLDAARDANKEFYDAARASGRASGQSLQAHKLALDTETWTLARMESAIQARKKFGEGLSDKERADITKLHEQFKTEREAADKAHAEEKNLITSGLLERVLSDIKEAKKSKRSGETIVDFGKRLEDEARQRLRARSGGKLFTGLDPRDLADHAVIGASWIIQGVGHLAKFTQKLVETYGEPAREHAEEIFNASKQQAEIFKATFNGARKARGERTAQEIIAETKAGAVDEKSIYELVKARIAEDPSVKLNKEKVSEIMSGVAKDLQEKQPGITEDQVRDAFSGHGQRTYPSREQINVKLRELRGASDLISKIGEASRKEPVQKTGPQRDKPAPFVRELTKELIRTMRENGIDTTAAEGMIKTAHDARVTRLKNSIEDTQRQLDSGKRTPETPGVEWTPEELALKDQLGELKSKLDDMLDEPDSDELHRLLNRIESVTDKLASGKIDAKGKSQNVPTKEVSEARDKLAGLNKELAARRKAKRDSENPPKTEDEKTLSALEKQEEALTEQIRTGAIDPKTGKPTADTKEVAAARERVAALRETISEARKAKRDTENPPKTPDEKTVEALEKRKAELENDIATGNIDPKTGRATVATAQQARLQSEIAALNKRKADMRKAANPKDPEHIRDLKKIQDQIDERTDALARGDVSAKTGKPTVDTKEKAGAKAELRTVNATIAEMRKKSTEGIAKDLENYKRMIERKSAELRDKIARGDTSPAVKRQLSDAKTKAALPLKKLQEQWETMKRKEELKNQNLLQKTLRWATYLGHEMLLLGSTVGQKLASAAATTSGFISPLEEIAGYGLGKALPFLAEKADVEIAPSARSLVRGEATAAADAFLRIVDDVGSALKNGKSDFELEFGKHYDTGMVSYVGRMHGALKTVPARQAFRRTFERLSEKYADRGLDVTDSDVRFDIGTQALEKALQAKFQDSNLAVKAFKSALRTVEQQSPNVGAVTKAIAKTDMPVMTVASNITWRALESVYGVPVASARLALKAFTNAYHNKLGGPKGAEFVFRSMNDLSIAEAESVALQFKRGAVGLAMFALGAYLYRNLGGFHQEGEKRKKDEIKPEEARTPIGDIPKEFIHHPSFTAMQAGAAMMQVAQSKLHKKDSEKQGIAGGLAGAAAGIVGETPMVQGSKSVVNVINPHTRMDAVGSFARTMLGISGPVSWLAKHQDKDSSGETVSRKPRTYAEELKVGIPGLRKSVPVRK